MYAQLYAQNSNREQNGNSRYPTPDLSTPRHLKAVHVLDGVLHDFQMSRGA
jgi:hypothetical protein